MSINFLFQTVLVSLFTLFLTATGASVLIGSLVGIPFVWMHAWVVFGSIVIITILKGLINEPKEEV